MALAGETMVVEKEKHAMWAITDDSRYKMGQAARFANEAKGVNMASGWDKATGPSPTGNNRQPSHAELSSLLKFTPGRYDDAHYLHEVSSASQLPVIERIKRASREPGRGELEAQTRILNRHASMRYFDRGGGHSSDM